MADLSFDPDEALRQTGGDDSILREVMQLFIDETSKREAELRQAMERRDGELLSRIAHSIKGSCVIFGAWYARDAAQKLELLGKGGDFEAAKAAVVLLLEETQRLSADLKAHLAASPT